MSIQTANTYRDAALSALASGDYAAARLQLDLAQVALGTNPDSRAGEFEMEWDSCRKSLQALSQMCTQRLSASAGIQVSKVTYANPSEY